MIRLLKVFVFVAGLCFGAPAAACEVEGVVRGFAPAGTLEGVAFVTPVIDGAVVEGCGEAGTLAPVMPDPYGSVWIRGTPRLAVGDHVRLRLRPGATLGTHAVAEVLPPTGNMSGDATVPSRPPAVRKSGNNVPACARERWRDGAFPLRVVVHDRTALSPVMPNSGERFAAIEQAASAWEAPSCSGVRIDVEAGQGPVPALDPDGVNSIGWIDEEDVIFANLGVETLAFTCHVCDEEGYFIEADVRFDGFGHSWSVDCVGDAFDIRGTAIHELGHVLGAPHVDDVDAAMHVVTSARRLLATQSLARADVDWLCANYPCEGSSDCAGVFDVPDNCPAGAGLCAPCASDAACGASTDLCLRSTSTLEQLCGRACSASFPCPDGMECAFVGGEERQCVPGPAGCPSSERAGCACTSDVDCDIDGRCLDEGYCAPSCGGSVACPEGMECTTLFDGSGLPDGRFCVAVGDPADVCGDSDGGRPRRRACGAVGTDGAGALWFAALVLGAGVVRKRYAR